MITFRPHHFMCTLGFCGHGYSIPFVDNYQGIVDQISNDPNTLIKVTLELDSICQACPYQTIDKKCSSQDFIEELDQRHQAVLDLKDGQILTWQDAKSLLKEKMTLDNFEKACDGCEWKALGVCEKALIKLQAEIKLQTDEIY